MLARDRGAPVDIIDLHKSFGGVVAVDGFSLGIRASEFVALLGPSGSGKTTILNMIAGFEQPTSGRILIDGHDITQAPANKRNLGMVFQRYALFPHMTASENISYPLRMRGVRKNECRRRVAELLQTVRLEGYGGRRPNQLSGGQQQRVAFARAIAHHPRALLMDEPLAALDKKLREQMQLEVKRLQRQLGITVIFVTHDQTEALTMADRVAVLNAGRLVQVGAPEELYEQPTSRFVADFLGETNFIEGHFADEVNGLGAIETGGRTFRGMLVGTAPSLASEACLAVRPEKILMSETQLSTEALPGKVEENVYGGATIAYVIYVEPSIRLTVRLPAHGRGSRRFKVGETVSLDWAPEDARIYSKGSS